MHRTKVVTKASILPSGATTFRLDLISAMTTALVWSFSNPLISALPFSILQLLVYLFSRTSIESSSRADLANQSPGFSTGLTRLVYVSFGCFIFYFLFFSFLRFLPSRLFFVFCRQMQECPEEPTHGYDGEPATFCLTHMAVGMKVRRLRAQ